MKVKVKEQKNGTCAIRLEIFDSIWVICFRMLVTWEHTLTQTAHTHTHRHTHKHTHTHIYTHIHTHTHTHTYIHIQIHSEIQG